MSEVWKKQFEKYDSLINSSFTLDDFLLTGKINVFGKSMTVSSKYKLNKTKDKSTEDGPLISSSEVSFSHKLFSKLSYTITQKQDITSLNINYPLLKKGLSNLSLVANTSLHRSQVRSVMSLSSPSLVYHEPPASFIRHPVYFPLSVPCIALSLVLRINDIGI